ncbi:DHA2 family efflux MFS transporter permease subunit [Candidatus Micrarchaeota archaeon]|nr:DHA2 family efflux MFS transporter permease subunit [Candidatus Micrarchaeota archaeon]
MSESGDNLRWWILLTVIIGTFLGRLDQTIVNLALPSIMEDFSITVSEAGWIATAYILANAVFVPVWGKLGDTIGRKKVYIWGFGLFILGSVLAGLAWDLNSMILFRVIQAIAGSADYPTAMAIIAVTFRGTRERAEALGIWSSAFAASAVFGPLLGGPLIDTFGWRSIFLINLPVGILGLAMAYLFVRESVSEKKTVKFDIWGALTLGIMLSALVLVLDKGLEWGWASYEALACYAAILLFGYAFYRIDSVHPEPIVDFKFFRVGAFVGALTNNFTVFMGMMGGVFLIPVFVQTFLGYDATQTGLMFMPMAAGMMISAPLGSKLVGRVKPGIVIAVSTFIAAIGMLLFLGLDPRSGPIDVVIPVFVMASGMGFAMAQRTNIIASAVPEEEIGVASSVLALVRNIAGAFGIAIFTTILKNATESSLLAISQNSIINTHDPTILQQAAALMVLKAQILGYHTVFITASAILFISAALALAMIRVEEKKGGAGVFVE